VEFEVRASDVKTVAGNLDTKGSYDFSRRKDGCKDARQARIGNYPCSCKGEARKREDQAEQAYGGVQLKRMAKLPGATTARMNQRQPFVDWYLLPESFSAPLVEAAIRDYNVKKGATILDPFAGAGTTLVTAKLNGYNGLGIEVNPFLCFSSRVKCRFDYNLDQLAQDIDLLLDKASSFLCHPRLFQETAHSRTEAIYHTYPKMPRLFKWISPKVVEKVLALKHIILTAIEEPAHRDLCLLGLAAILRPVSNMKLTPHAFGSRKVKEDAPVFEEFESKICRMLADLKGLPQGKRFGQVEVVEGDVREVKVENTSLLPASLAITSPPYLNNLDYTMQTRLELFFLDFVKDMNDLRALRKRMIVSDAKAMYKEIKDHYIVENFPSVRKVVEQLKEKLKDKNWGWDYAFMTAQYFGGMYRALQNVYHMLEPGARFIVVVGESAHSGVLVPVPAIIGDLAQDIGYHLENVAIHRKRRSSSHKYELSEASVILKRP